MNKKHVLLFTLSTFALLLTSCQGAGKIDPWKDITIEKGINLYKYTYEKGVDETIDVLVDGYEDGYSLGIYDRDAEPGGPAGAIRRKPLKDDVKIYSFEIKDLKKSGEYNLFIMDKNLDIVYDFEVIEILEEDLTNYKVSSASVTFGENDGILTSSVDIQTTHTNELTYFIYWAKDGVRLKDYTYIKTFVSEGLENIHVDFNDGMFAPKEANQIEIRVKEGRSESIFVSITDELQLEQSTYKTTMQIASDIHIESKYTCKNYNSHFVSNLNATKNYENATSGMVFVGDVANSGNQNNYDLFYQFIDSVFDNRPTLYPIVGNHELQYFDTYDEAINTYKTATGMPGAYFEFEIGGIRCFALGSEDTSTHGAMSTTQLNWFKDRISESDKNDQIMIFMHQGIYNTVSGTLPGHGWHGLNTKTNGIRDVIKNYPNAFVFSGHSHQDLNCIQSTLIGRGEDANYVNCGSCAYVLDDNRETTYGSTFYFVDIYEDYLTLRGRLSIEDKWISCAQYVIPFVK